MKHDLSDHLGSFGTRLDLRRPPLVPEIELWLLGEAVDLEAGCDQLAEGEAPPFWAFCWGSGQALARYVLDHPERVRNQCVVDLGTGSGVLAIAAVKLGARQATGIDRDPDALASAKESVAANHVASRVALRNADVAQLAEQPDTVAVIVANLTGAILISLAPVITTLVEPGGYIVLGGILAEEEAAVARAYRAGAHCAWRAVEDEWVGMIWKARPRQGQRIEPRWHSRIIEREGRSQKAEEDG